MARFGYTTARAAELAAQARDRASGMWQGVIGRLPDPNQDINALAAVHQVGRPDDIIDILPEAAADRLHAWRNEHADARAAYETFRDRWHELYKLKQEADARYSMMTNGGHASRTGTVLVSEDHPSAIDAKKQADRAARDCDDMTAKRDAAGEKVTHLVRIMEDCENYLKSLPAGVAIAYLPTKAKGKLDECRKEVDRMRADLDAIATAAHPSGKARAAARAEIERLAARGRPDVFNAIQHDEPVKWPKARNPVNNVGLLVGSGDGAFMKVGGSSHAEAPDTLALFAWLHKDAMIAAVEREIDELADDDMAMTDEERAKQSAEITADLLGVQRIEVALIDDARFGSGAYRIGTDPRALLCIDGPAPREGR